MGKDISEFHLGRSFPSPEVLPYGVQPHAPSGSMGSPQLRSAWRHFPESGRESTWCFRLDLFAGNVSRECYNKSFCKKLEHLSGITQLSWLELSHLHAQHARTDVRFDILPNGKQALCPLRLLRVSALRPRAWRRAKFPNTSVCADTRFGDAQRSC